MYRIAISALLLAFAASSNAQAPGLRLNELADRLAGDLPLLGNLVSTKGPTLPLLGDLPGIDLLLSDRVFLLGGANLVDLLDAVNVGSSGREFGVVLTGQLRESGALLGLE